MIIRTLELEGIGPFRRASFEFRKGMNVVCGPNDSGKTLMLEALGALLCGAPAGTFSRSAETRACRGIVMLEGGGSVLRLERDFCSGQARLSTHDDLYHELEERRHTATESPEEPVGPDLRRWLGVAGRSQFRTALVLDRRSELVLTAPDSLQVFLSQVMGDDGGAWVLLETLRAELRTLEGEGSGEGEGPSGELEVLALKLAELETAWQEQRRQLHRLAQLRDQAEADSASTSEPAAAVDVPIRASLAVPRPEPAPALEEEQELPETLFGAAEPAAELVFGGEGELDDFTVGGDDPDALRRQLWHCQQQTTRMRQEIAAFPEVSVAFPAALSLLFVLLGAALALFQPDVWLPSLAGGILLAGVSWGLHLLLSRGKKQGLLRLRRELVQYESEQQGLLERLDQLAAAGISPRTSNLPAKPEGLARSVSPAESITECAPPDAVDAVGALSAGGRETAGAEGHDEPASRDAVTAECRLLLLELADLRRIELEGESLRYRERLLLQRRNVLLTAIELLRKGLERYSQQRLESFTRAFNRALFSLTHGLVTSGRIDLEKGIELALAEGWTPLGDCGEGLRTSAVLALHLARLDVAPAQHTVPFFIDDPFLALDRDRRELALREIEQAAGRHQVILFSRDEGLMKRAARSGWHLIQLGQAAAVAPSSPKPESRRDHDEQLHLL